MPWVSCLRMHGIATRNPSPLKGEWPQSLQSSSQQKCSHTDCNAFVAMHETFAFSGTGPVFAPTACNVKESAKWTTTIGSVSVCCWPIPHPKQSSKCCQGLIAGGKVLRQKKLPTVVKERWCCFGAEKGPAWGRKSQRLFSQIWKTRPIKNVLDNRLGCCFCSSTKIWRSTQVVHRLDQPRVCTDESACLFCRWSSEKRLSIGFDRGEGATYCFNQLKVKNWRLCRQIKGVNYFWGSEGPQLEPTEWPITSPGRRACRLSLFRWR